MPLLAQSLAFFRFLDHLVDVLTGPNGANLALNIGAAWAAIVLLMRQRRAEKRQEAADNFTREQAKAVQDREAEKARLQLVHNQKLQTIAAEAAAAAQKAVLEARAGREAIAEKITKSQSLRADQMNEVKDLIKENTALTQEARNDMKVAVDTSNHISEKILTLGLQMKHDAPTVEDPMPVKVVEWPENTPGAKEQTGS